MMRILCILTISATLSALLPTVSSAKVKKLDYNVDIGIQAVSVDSDKVRAKLWSVKPRLRSRYEMDESSTFFLDFGAALETGSNRSFNIDEYAPRREFYVSNAYFQFRWWDTFAVEVGAINQEFYHSPIFIDYIAFIGAREMFTFDMWGLKFNLFAQQSIPNNQYLSNKIPLVEEGTPLFYGETFEVAYQDSNIRVLLSYTHFLFKNLSYNTAAQSRYLGNTVIGDTDDNAVFAYEFQGHNTALMISYRLPSFLIEFQGHYLHNNHAPNSKADGYFAGFYIGKPNLFLHLEKYEIEADATIAFFNSGLYGHNNRSGNAVGFTYEKNNSYTATFLYHIQDIINASPFQAKRNLVTFLVTKEF